jgi:hypothetical protein
MRPFFHYFSAAFFFLNAVHAFMPWDWRENLVGKGGTSHQKMTRKAFE